ncbi:hypothetical protein O6H91_01G124700 [Diphasiastrum complanatum]|uniref:Uncharacterized protein n=1 Tax=Diphasiastrum complanatum TaxID=34168 RepID=A0ACC2EW12_DIPCM|nr:hypothetical protein O6H91_Y447400 [Diphasiastrum complanatum]KAJ7570545.1 hypothetical protein O6H91_01G124700 [Diphasiastrum complanatum]
MMHMTFYWGKGVTLLIDQWITRTWLQYGLSLLLLFVAGVIQESLSRRRARVAAAVRNLLAAHSKSEREVPLLRDQHERSHPRLVNALDALLYGINVALSYLLMLAIMSFNGGVFVSIVLGHTLGYYLFHSESDPVRSGHACG